MTMKSRETTVMRQISRELQRGFLADLGAAVSVILGSLPSGARCRPVSSPEEHKRRGLRDFMFVIGFFFRIVSERNKNFNST